MIYKGRESIAGLADGEDRLIAMVTALTSELSVTRERLDTLERVLQRSGQLSETAMEGYRPDLEAVAARDSMRKRLITKIFRPMRDASARAAAATGAES